MPGQVGSDWSFAALQKLHISTAEPDTTAANKTSPANDLQQPFRFLSLPQELRDHVHGLITYRPGRQLLGVLKPPAITRANRQIRAEAIPVYFEVNTFEVDMVVPYSGYRSLYGRFHGQPHRGKFLSQDDPRWQRTGKLGIPPQVLSFVENAGALDAWMRDVILNVKGTRALEPDRWTHEYVIRLQHGKHMEVKPFRQGRFEDDVDRQNFNGDWAYIWKLVAQALADRSTRLDNRGFGVAELQDIVALFRRAPRAGGEVLLRSQWE
ncbi:hypothetical protein LTR09_001383 [Extremus antarcticus]|uniref:Uncharacterized protein n=1 Tax=Extremus antarcticus TaxID=702011 RepID=A0AAJ0GIT4_9PEZI|nr:hypothetical protein LTR09_001383 [Extremus antarcticus]